MQKDHNRPSLHACVAVSAKGGESKTHADRGPAARGEAWVSGKSGASPERAKLCMAVRCDAELPAAAIFRTFDPSRNSSLSRTISIAQPVEKLKTSTSAWMKMLGPRYAEFHWQGGYSAFSVCESIAPKVREYIRGQRSIIGRGRFWTSCVRF